MKIVVQEYTGEWERQFNRLKQIYVQTLKGIDVDIEHVGSTSVKGLAAKPIIDIDIIVSNNDDVKLVIDHLHAIGYHHQGDLGIKGREAFSRKSEQVPYDGNQTIWCNHHLYVCMKGTPSLENHLRLRDYLRNNKDAVKEYGELKKQLAAKFPNDIDAYIEGKTPFITNILAIVGLGEHVNDIVEQNKKKNQD